MKILLIFSGALGDFINFIPFIEHIKLNFKNPEITIITKSYFFPIIEKIDSKISKIDFEYTPIYKLYNHNPDFSRLEFLKNFDLIITFTGVKNEIFRKNLEKLNRNSHFIFPINKDEKISEALYLINSFPFKKKFFPKPNIPIKLKDRKFIAIHPGSGDKRKNVKIDFFYELSKELDYPVVLFGGENEVDLAEKFKIKICKNLNEVFEIFENTLFYIGNDSGISHLAGSCNIPGIVFFGPTNYKIWKPVGEKILVIRKNLNCSPCNLNCKKGYECLNFDFKEIKSLILNYLKNVFD